MTKREVYKEILDTVSGICEVSVEDILCGVRNCEVVEARCIAAHYLMRYGVLPADVVRFSNGEVKHRHCVTKSTSPEEFFNSLTHKSRHLEAHIAQTLNLDPYGEEICYVSGEIAEKLLPTAQEFWH